MKAGYIIASCILVSVHAGAQISGRPGMDSTQRQAKDTSLVKKQLIERQYDSLIHQSEDQLKALYYHIIIIQKDIEAAKAQLKELEEAQKGFKANQTQPKAEVEQKISTLNKKIADLLYELENKKNEASLLKQKISLWEKEKQEMLKKL